MLDLVLSQPLPLAEAVTGAILAGNACKGVSKLCKLMLGNQFRLQKYKDDLMQAQADRDTKAIKADDARFDGTTLHPVLALPDMPLNATLEYLPVLEGQRQEALNYNENLSLALGILKETPESEVSDEPVSPDWFARWRREAQLIGDHGLQTLWSSILAEEVKNPNAISLKTLDILKNISAKDAELFSSIAQYRINNIIPAELLKNMFGNDISAIIRLQYLDLINAGSNYSTPPSSINENDGNGYACCNCMLFFQPDRLLSPLELTQGYAISLAGMEILNISEKTVVLSDEVIRKVGDIVWASVNTACTTMKAFRRSPDGSYNDGDIIQTWEKI